MWNAKPKGGYSFESGEALENIRHIWQFFELRGYTREAAAGVMGNIQAESGFNPWRWQGDKVNNSAGYGLFQFTPARGYLNITGSKANKSVSCVTYDASPEDGRRQLEVFDDNELKKWTTLGWRPYWDSTKYGTLYAKSRFYIDEYASGRVKMSDLRKCTNIDAATFFVLACFEGPAVPNFEIRAKFAHEIYNYLLTL